MPISPHYKSAWRFLATALLLWLAVMPQAWAQDAQLQHAATEATPEPITLTLDEAIQIAIVNNYTVRNNRLDVNTAEAQVREAWGQVMPQVDVSSSYTRNLKSANPFAGSDAGGLFGSLGFIDWLAFNEGARTDDDPATIPISFGEFAERQREGLEAAGIQQNAGDNPFAVPNSFQNSLNITQTLFSGSAFAAIKGAERLKEVNRLGVDRQEQVLIDQVRQAFYQSLLAQEQMQVVGQSVQRTQATLNETAKRVTQGVAPKYQRLSAEVELNNLETQLLQTQNQASSALDNLKFTLGIPMSQPVQLRGELEVDDADPYLTVSVRDAYATAMERRPDIEQARVGIELRQIDKNITRAQYLPEVSAFANFSYSGSVPDDRSFTISDPNDPFQFTTGTNDFFSSSYWQPAINVGFRLTWNIFNGFQTTARVQQRQIEVERARLQYTQLTESVRLEVETALRDLETAQRRILSQERNVDRAELNYEYAHARLREGVATPLEERDASDQLDQSRLNYIQAVHDYLLARSAFETAMGVPLNQQADLKLTSH